MQTQDELKKAVAEAALKYVEDDSIVGVGTGSTANFFIDALASMKNRIEGTVASSVESENRLKALGIPVFDLTTVNNISVYVDGADEVDQHGYLIKGRGGALTREKIVAASADKFVCVIDESKWVNILGEQAALPLEVVPMARSLVGREIAKLGANPVYREHFLTDNGNIIIDVYGLKIDEPLTTEVKLNSIPGVVENGLFAYHSANVILLGSEEGVKTITPQM